MYSKIYNLRFITSPSQDRQTERRPGPASQTIFAVDRTPPNGSSLRYDPRFRTELSSVYSQLYFLQQHALVTSIQESRPLLNYYDR